MVSEELKLILQQQAQLMATMQSQMQMLQQQMANKSGINDNDTKSRVNVPWPQPLEVSSGEPSENLSFFKNGWTNYCLATGMNKWGDDKMELKAGLLISAIGSAAMKKYMEFGLTNKEKLSEEAILSKMDETIKKKTNVIYCRYIFNARNQLIEERFEDYLLILRKLIKPCDYGDIEDDILRDRIVVGIKDSEVKKELLREADLKLDLTISICRSAETAAEQLTTLQSSECEVNEISKYKKNYKEVQQCKFCGQKHIFGRDRCPAYGKRCEACKGRNHFKLVCKKDQHHRAIKEVREDYNSSEEEPIIKAIRANKKSGHTEAELIFKIKGKWIPLFCTLDTGAQVCVMSISDYKRLTGSEDVSSLATPLHKLKCYNGSELVEYGVAQLECLKNNKLYRIEFHIVEASHEPLLSENACLALGLIKYCNSVNSGDIKDRARAIELFKEYSDIFEGYGKLPGEVSLEIDTSVPPRIQSARRVPMAVREKLKQELQQLEKDGIIIQEMQHTDWVNNILIVHKDSKFRICLDPIPLNKALKRPNYQFTTLDEMLPELDKAKVFTTVDTKKGFWQLGLTEESSKLTTFWTPFGRFRWLRLPFGLCSSPEIFQQKLSSLLSGLKGVEIIADDILIYGVGDSTEEAIADHNIKLEELFKRLRKINCKLNKDKVHLLQSSVKFYGHVLTSEGVKVDESKVIAIKNMPTPESAKDVLRFLGMVGYLGKFIKNLSFQANSLRKLTRKDTEFHWSQTEEMEFNNIKKIISKLPTLRYFDVNKNVSIECDASEFGLGAALYQDDQVVGFASRCLTPTEKRYAQIEKEMLAVVFACTKFNQYIAGKGKVTIKTDHKPLVNIMNKPLIDAPKRLQMMLMTLQKYNVELQFIQGKDNHVADTLSRAPIVEQPDTVYDLESELSQKQVFKLISEHSKISFLKISDKLTMKIKEETERDHNLQIIMNYIINGFPRYISDWSIELRALYKFRHELSTKNGLIFRNDQLLIPIRLRKIMTEKVHVSHNGISATLRLARENIFWPGMTVDIKEHVGKCKFCAENAASQERQSLMSHEIPVYPFQYISMDVFSVNNLKFLITVDHYSDFFELDPLSSLTTREVIQICKKNFSRHGAPQKVCSDNATNFNNEEFKKFAEDWNFEHVTSSPHFPSSNGKAEATVKVARRLVVASLETKQDLWYSLLHHRNIPIEADKVSPVQKLFSRRTRTGLPCVLDHLKPKVVHKVPVLIKKRKEKVQERYDSRSKALPKLTLGESVMVQLQPESSKRWSFGKVVHIHNERSFTVQVKDKLYRRNRVHIKPFLGDTTQAAPVENRRVAPDEPQTESSFSDLSGVPVPGFEVVHCHSPRVLQSPVQAQEAPRRGQRLRLQPRRLQDYVPAEASSLTKDQCFILENEHDIFVLMPEGAKATQRRKIISVANSLRDDYHNGRATIEIIDEFSSDEDVALFFETLGSGSREDIADDSTSETFSRDSSTVFLSRVLAGDELEVVALNKPFKQKHLTSDNIYVLDTPCSGVFMWLGSEVDADTKKNYHDLAQQYLEVKGYPTWMPVTRVTEGAESSTFKQFFHNWDTVGAAQTYISETDAGYFSGDAEESAAVAKLIGKSAAARGYMPDEGEGTLTVTRVAGDKEDITEKVLEGTPVFYQTEAYVVNYKYTNENGDDAYIIYWWIGSEASSDDKKAARELVTELECELDDTVTVVKVPQGKEPKHFLNIFKGNLVVLFGGKDHDYKPVNANNSYEEDSTRLFRVEGTKLGVDMRAVQVAEKAEILEDDDVFVLETADVVYVRNGQESHEYEREAAVNFVKQFAGDREVTVLEQGEESDAFWEALGGVPEEKEDPSAWRLEVNRRVTATRTLTTVSVSITGKVKFEELPLDYKQQDLSDDGVYILDTGEELYLWQGKNIPERVKSARSQIIEDYIKDDGLERTVDSAIVVSVKQGSEPKVFKKLFSSWEDDMWENQPSYEDVKNEAKAGNSK